MNTGICKDFPKEAIILSAGIGSRLRPYTATLPKVLMPLINKPVIAWLIEKLKKHGVQQFYINLHHLGTQVENFLGDGSKFSVKIQYFYEEKLLGSGGSIQAMLPAIKGEHFVCVNGDSMQLADLQEAWHVHLENKAAATMVLSAASQNTTEQTLGVLREKKKHSGRINEFLQKKYYTEKESDLLCCFLGAHFFDRDFLENNLKQESIHCINRDGYYEWLLQGKRLFGYISDMPLLDIGTPERFLQVQKYIFDYCKINSAISSQASIANDVIVRPPIAIEAGAIIAANTTVGPYVAIGQNCHIANNCVLSDSLLLPGAKLKAGEKLHGKIIA